MFKFKRSYNAKKGSRYYIFIGVPTLFCVIAPLTCVVAPSLALFHLSTFLFIMNLLGYILSDKHFYTQFFS